jgi:hypothetical protein
MHGLVGLGLFLVVTALFAAVLLLTVPDGSQDPDDDTAAEAGDGTADAAPPGAVPEDAVAGDTSRR